MINPLPPPPSPFKVLHETTTTALVAPRTEKDLEEIRKLPDCVGDLQTFDRNPAQRRNDLTGLSDNPR